MIWSRPDSIEIDVVKPFPEGSDLFCQLSLRQDMKLLGLKLLVRLVAAAGVYYELATFLSLQADLLPVGFLAWVSLGIGA